MKNKNKKKKKSRWISFLKHPFSRKNEPTLHTIEWLFILLAFFVVGLGIILYQESAGTVLRLGDNQTDAEVSSTLSKYVGEIIPEPLVDITGWDTYRNKWYGFEIKKPEGWTNMQFKSASARNDRFDIVYKFRKDDNGQNDPYVGFNVIVYSKRKVGDILATNEILRLESAPQDTSGCQYSEEMTLGEDSNKFQKVSISQGNACYEPAYFFNFAEGNYMYDIVPVAKDGAEIPANPEQDVAKNFPEFKEVVASFKSVPVSRPVAIPKTAAPKPRITARRPVAAKVVNGQLVCAKKNDKPGKSKNGNKPGHMDMECCLDPDEKPNPWCSYNSSKYKKYL